MLILKSAVVSAAALLANAIFLQTGDSAVHQATTLAQSVTFFYEDTLTILAGWRSPKSWGIAPVPITPQAIALWCKA